MTDGGAVVIVPRARSVTPRCTSLAGPARRRLGGQIAKETIMYGYSGMMGGFGAFGGGLIWLLVLIVLALTLRRSSSIFVAETRLAKRQNKN